MNEVGRKTNRKTSKKEKTSKIQKNRKKMKNVYVKMYARKFLNGCLTWETYRRKQILKEF